MIPDDKFPQSDSLFLAFLNSFDVDCCLVDILLDESRTPTDYRIQIVSQSLSKRRELILVREGVYRFNASHEREWLQMLGEIACTGKPARSEYFLPQSGRWSELYGFRIGSPKHARVAIRFSDVTARRQAENAEAAIRKSEIFLRMIANNIPGLVSYWNRELRCQFSNAGIQAWFGYTAEQMQNIRLPDLLGDELYKKNEAHISKVLDGEDQAFERTVVKPDGKVAHVWTQYIAHKEAREVKGFLVLVTDLTRIKQAEEKLKAVESAAEAQVNVIRQLKSQSKDLNTALSTLIKHNEDIVQDDRVALSQEMEQEILPFLNQLKSECLGPKQKALVRIIETNLQQLISSYGRSTAFSSATKKLSPKEIQIASMIRQGLHTKEIAATLSLSTATINNHRKNIRRKLGLTSKAANLQSNLSELHD